MSRSRSSRRDVSRAVRLVTLALLLALVTTVIVGCSSLAGFGWHPLAYGSDSPFVVGRMQRHRIAGKETLLDLTRSHGLGYAELVAANPGVDAWLPGEGTVVELPTAHLLPVDRRKPRPRGLLINLADQRLYYFPDDRRLPIESFAIGVSRDGWTTPLGSTRVVRKRESPIWYPTRSAKREDPTLPDVVRAGPENPLGAFALYLDWPRYLIHGTNEPDGVGRRVSRGCIRLYPEGIERVFAMTEIDTPVRVIHEPVKIARIEGEVYLEVHPTLDELVELETKGLLSPRRPDDLRERIREVAGEAASERIDWRLAYRTAAERRGVPVRITR